MPFTLFPRTDLYCLLLAVEQALIAAQRASRR
jgi:hypothetical protein